MITYKQLERVRQANSKLSDNMKAKITEVIERTKPQGEEALRSAILEELAPVMAEADEIAAQMSAAMYNGWRFKALGLTTETVTESAYDQGKIEAMANTAAKAAREGETVEAVINIVNGRASYDLRKSYGDTMIANAGRDTHDVRFARIPGASEHYSGGCPFCRMLASRGFVYHSKATAGEFGHYHDGCTCEIVAQFDKNPKVEGYDPDAYYDEYLAARDYAKSQNGGKPVTAEDVARAYRELGNSGRVKANKAIGATRSKLYDEYMKRVSNKKANIVNNRQRDHVLGEKQFENNRKSRLKSRKREPSYFTLSYKETEELVKKHVGKGFPLMEKNSDRWNKKEICVASKNIGEVVTNDGRRLPTRYFKIHYGDTSIHAVPMYDEGGAPDDLG